MPTNSKRRLKEKSTLRLKESTINFDFSEIKAMEH